ncbi:lipocalin-like domain-containing protein, partial [Thermodesulfobacteriota bacterium]
VEKNRFVGTWSLASSEFRLSDGQVVYPLGEEATGILSYDAEGYMSAQLMRSERPVFASDNPLGGAPKEIKAAFEGYVAYFGTYEIKEEKKTVIHHVAGSWFPNWVGSDQIRYFEFSGNRLTLTTPPISFGDLTLTGLLVWERAV